MVIFEKFAFKDRFDESRQKSFDCIPQGTKVAIQLYAMIIKLYCKPCNPRKNCVNNDLSPL